MAINPNLHDLGAPEDGRGIEDISAQTSLVNEAQDLINEITDLTKLTRGKPMNSAHKSKKLHIDGVPIGSKTIGPHTYTHKVEVQRTTGSKNTVAICLVNATATPQNVRAALLASLQDQHKWGVT